MNLRKSHGLKNLIRCIQACSVCSPMTSCLSSLNVRPPPKLYQAPLWLCISCLTNDAGGIEWQCENMVSAKLFCFLCFHFLPQYLPPVTFLPFSGFSCCWCILRYQHSFFLYSFYHCCVLIWICFQYKLRFRSQFKTVRLQTFTKKTDSTSRFLSFHSHEQSPWTTKWLNDSYFCTTKFQFVLW